MIYTVHLEDGTVQDYSGVLPVGWCKLVASVDDRIVWSYEKGRVIGLAPKVTQCWN